MRVEQNTELQNINNLNVSNFFIQKKEEEKKTQNLSLEEFIETNDEDSTLNKKDFNLKNEDFNFVWKNKEKLEDKGFIEDDIREVVAKNDINHTINSFWDNVDQNKLNHEMSDEEKQWCETKKKNQEKQKAETTNALTGGSAMNSPGSAISGGNKCITGGKKSASQGKADDQKLGAQIEQTNKDITSQVNTIENKRQKSLQKMQKATQKSQQLTAKANAAMAKVGLKAIKGQNLKSKQKVNNAVNVKTDATGIGQGNDVAQNATTNANVSNKEANITQESTNSANQIVEKTQVQAGNNATVQETSKSQSNEVKKEEVVTKENVQKETQKQKQKKKAVNNGVMSLQKKKYNDEAVLIGKSIESDCKQSLNRTAKTFNKLENYSMGFTEINEYYLETVEKYGERRQKNRGKINTGIAETVVGGDFIICGIGNICSGTPWGIAAGIAMVVVGAVVTAVGVCEIQDGQEGHKETRLESRETFLRTKETEKEANDAIATAENDEKQTCAVEKNNIQQEKEIDKILAQAAEQEKQASQAEAA